ncbi:tRNA (adenosine(37)-N6)-threonylcarbamoyltransferase complex ATPase subunit type 1 TsaE [Cobetia marina]|uniref:tRNA (adenosine(37)-N6)-threonylcarbamoyltransferase complex ATPase subunit type 1 TsaE n=1 Tax=Cobetia marina TaxID=28258 RepID=UPI0026E368E0|nr:tRNA (adenosine(37)-N6)-threonylcarbamoyltransferase complex ATPase subunit type 1 TsaE [Cobetia marina]MDO6787993.1 tRNA (adenosine(37)-N6)-threonylcarbamoyltransferase complex ATPase subunit type 1 TsaE [Cobetia marina]
MRILLSDENAQVAFGSQLGDVLAGRGLVFLEGELGAGKTTLTRGVLRSYGHEGAVKSPTYTLVEPYVLPRPEGGEWHINHFDLYRLADPEELEFIGGRDLLADDSLALIEWPSCGQGFLPVPDLRVTLSVAEQGREAELHALTPRGEGWLEALAERRASQA